MLKRKITKSTVIAALALTLTAGVHIPAYATGNGEGIFIPVEESVTTGADMVQENEKEGTELETEKGTPISELESSGTAGTELGTATSGEMQTSPEYETVQTTAPAEKSEVQRSRWNISKGYPRTQVFSVDVKEDTTRFEVFYSSDSSVPDVIITSPAGNAYSSKKNVTEGETSFITRAGYKVQDYNDISYMVVYISNPSDPGTWDMTITIDENCSEAFVMTSKVPENWEDLQTEYKTSPTGVIAWAIDSETSQYKASDITEITKKDSNIPASMQPVAPKEPEKPDYTVAIVLGIMVIIILIIMLVVFLVQKSKAREKEKRQEAVNKANERVKQRKKKENATLENVLKTFDDEYTDDEDMSAYITASADDEKRSYEEKLTEPVSGILPATQSIIARYTSDSGSAPMPQNSVQQNNENAKNPVQKIVTQTGQISSTVGPSVNEQIQKQNIQPIQPSWISAQKTMEEQEKIPSWAIRQNSVQKNNSDNSNKLAQTSTNKNTSGGFI